jgi:hypothetical protein
MIVVLFLYYGVVRRCYSYIDVYSNAITKQLDQSVLQLMK